MLFMVHLVFTRPKEVSRETSSFPTKFTQHCKSAWENRPTISTIREVNSPFRLTAMCTVTQRCKSAWENRPTKRGPLSYADWQQCAHLHSGVSVGFLYHRTQKSERDFQIRVELPALLSPLWVFWNIEKSFYAETFFLLYLFFNNKKSTYGETLLKPT